MARPDDFDRIWTDADFDAMGWHDARIFAIDFPRESYSLTFEIAYIFEWVPVDDGFRFWVSRCDLIFDNVSQLRIDLDVEYSVEIYIMDIARGDEHRNPGAALGARRYTLECSSGTISFRATGYRQRVRHKPVLSARQDGIDDSVESGSR
jgi:hypothetical protein